MVQIRGLFYARWTVAGKRVYGEPRETYDQADADRLNLRPSDSQPVLSTSDIPTLAEWAHRCQTGRYGSRIAQTTLGTNETIRLRFIEDSVIGRKRLHRITRSDVQRHIDEVRVLRSRREGKEIVYWEELPSPSYLRRIAAFESKLFSLAVDEGLIRSSPMRGIELPEVEERENRTLSPTEAMKLLNPRTRTDAIMLVAMHTGMRRDEIRRLEWRHVGPDFVKVPGTKSKKSKAAVPMTPECYAAIMSQPKRSQFVFTTESGKQLGARNITRDIGKRKLELGIPPETRLHDLRGSYISLLVESGTDMRTVMELARHSDIRTTMKAYARSRQDVKIEAVAKLRAKIVPQVDISRMKDESG